MQKSEAWEKLNMGKVKHGKSATCRKVTQVKSETSEK